MNKKSRVPEKEAQANIARAKMLSKKWEREEAALMRMPKEERLKMICKKHLLSAVNLGKIIFWALRERKRGARGLDELTKKRLGFELTMALKKAGVLPLERKAA